MNSGRQARGPLYAYVGGGSSIFVCDAGWVSSVRVFAGLVPRSSGSFRWSPSALIVGGMVVAAGGTSPISAIQFVSVVFTCFVPAVRKSCQLPVTRWPPRSFDHSTLFW